MTADTGGSLGIGEENFSDNGVNFFDTNMDKRLDFQVLLPDFEFDCYGYISNWSALTVLHPGLVGYAPAYARLQIWRPSIDQPDMYTLVDSTEIILTERNLPNRQIPDSESELKLYNLKEGPDKEADRLYFKPHDIVGFFVYQYDYNALRIPLSITFRNPTAQEASATHGVVSRMYVQNATADYKLSGDLRQPCSASKCAEKTTIYGVVVPQLQINYGELFVASS